MAIEGTHSVRIRREPQHVFALLSDLARAPEWVPGLVAVHVTTPGPVGVGTRFHQEVHLAGRDVLGQGEVTEYAPARAFGHVGSEASVRFSGRFELAPDAEGTRVTHRYEVRLRGLMRAMAPAVSAWVESNTEQALENLRALLET